MSSLDLLRSVLADICRYVWIKPQYLLQTFALMAPATRSVNLELQPSKIQVWRASCQDTIPPELQDKVKLTLSCLGGHVQIHGDVEPGPIVLGETSMENQTTFPANRHHARCPQRRRTVNDLLTMYVGAALCQKRRPIILIHRSRHFGRTSSNATSLHRCSFYLSNLGDLVWALLSSGMLLHHGVLGNRSFLHSWRQPSSQTQTPFSTRHHDFEPNFFNFKPHCHY